MSEDNGDRAERARQALDTYGNLTGQRGYDYSTEEQFAEIASDLLADLFHAANLAGVDPEELVRRATLHHTAEVAQEGAR